MFTLLALPCPIALAQGDGERAGFVLQDVMDHTAGRITDPLPVVAALAELDALPRDHRPTVISIKSIDSVLAGNSVGDLALQIIIGETVAEMDGPTSIRVVAPWGRPQDRALRGDSYFPVTSEQRRATNYGWLLEPDGFVLRWDPEGTIAELTAGRAIIFGGERLGFVNLIICANNQEIFGWAKSDRDHQPTRASIGRFTEDCLGGRLGLQRLQPLAVEFLERHGLMGRSFAVLMPDAYADEIDPLEAVATVELTLARASVPIQLVVVAIDTYDDDFTVFVPAEEHLQDLVGLGVPVDEVFSREMPRWVRDYFATHSTTLVIFDDRGEAVAHLGSINASFNTGWASLNQVLLGLGLF